MYNTLLTTYLQFIQHKPYFDKRIRHTGLYFYDNFHWLGHASWASSDVCTIKPKLLLKSLKLQTNLIDLDIHKDKLTITFINLRTKFSKVGVRNYLFLETYMPSVWSDS